MMNQLILSFICPDRPGLVDTLSDVVKQHEGNWQTSSLHHLSGFFSGVVEIAVSEANTTALIDKIHSIPTIKCIIEQTHQHSASQASIVLELTANDRSGIVQDIASVVHQQGGNLLKLVSAHEAAAHTGVALFKAKVSIDVAPHKVDELITALESTADDLMVDVSR
ncbi:ACT domain-containing protein [Thalassotalea sp. 1_MG-2023]|uniref:glycine cleavage system protein R n=1 Tax=Thalassotalea sp. 1_MG-2023 TaxID=3062680 RepID=UPI0026E37173|nr:ACT domain-containing protein [Thalassotalea sp. 1_MG-2023]MDO6427494.1 ACT domain-containing protein [Thalassotalea sp. 1_MG-2023]